MMTAYLFGLVLTITVILGALLYLRNPLLAILTDLCGTAVRARFWTAFSNVTLFLFPLALTLDHRPVPNSVEPGLFVIAGQVESAALGLAVSVVVLGITLSWHIARSAVQTTRKNDAPAAQ